MDNLEIERTQIESWADSFKEDFSQYIETESFKNQAEKDPVIRRFSSILLLRVEVSEINFEIWVKDMRTGTQAFFDKEGLTKEALGKIMADFAKKIAVYEEEQSINYTE